MRAKRRAFIRLIGIAASLVLLAAFFLWLGGRTEARQRMKMQLPGWEQALVAVLEAPENLEELWENPQLLAHPDKPAEMAAPDGKHYRLGQDPVPVDKKLLYSLYDYQDAAYVVQLLNLPTAEVLQEWRLPFSRAKQLFAQTRRQYKGDKRYPFLNKLEGFSLAERAPYHPLPLGNKQMAISCEISGTVGMMVCLDSASRVCWVAPKMVHHSKEPSLRGGFWAPSRGQDTILGRQGGKTFSYLEDLLTKFDAQGHVVFQKKVSRLFRSAEHYDHFSTNLTLRDRYHLNDIQPVHSHSRFWQPGDLFISLRQTNTLLLYRPSTDSVLWSKTGPWLSQHDVEVVNDSLIMVYDNHTIQDFRSPITGFVPGAYNRLHFYDFGQDSAYTRFDSLMKQKAFCSNTLGQTTFLPQDSLLLVESDYQRQLLLHDLAADQNYTLVLPSEEKGFIRPLTWVRLLD